MIYIYLAGIISGKGYAEITADFGGRKAFLEDVGYKVLSPMTGKEHLRNETKFKSVGYPGSPVATNGAIVGRDNWMVDRADIIFVNLLGATDKVSIGCMMEMARGKKGEKLIVLVMEKDPKENIHHHAFVLETADLIFETVEEALIELGKMIA